MNHTFEKLNNLLSTELKEQSCGSLLEMNNIVQKSFFKDSLVQKQKKGEFEFINPSASTKCNSPLGSISDTSSEPTPTNRAKNHKKISTSSKYQVTSKEKSMTTVKQTTKVVHQSVTVQKTNINGKRASEIQDSDTSSVSLGITKKQKITVQREKVIPQRPQPAILTPFAPLEGTCKELTPFVALDCEMVMVEGYIHELARCSIVDYNGHVLFDEMIKPKGKITNYLTWVSGITPSNLKGAKSFDDHKNEILDILKGKTIVGHSLKNDFEALKFSVQEKNTRDLAHFTLLKKEQKILSLKKMVSEHLDMDIQNGQHDSVEDARAAMAIYRKFEKQWEEQIKHSNYGMVRNQFLSDLKMFTQK